jgi:sugar-specific transcriptional regulator TrmB
MKYSAKLKIAMEKIKDVIKEYDVAAIVVLHTPGFSEYYTKINPSYSSARMDNNGKSVHVNIKLEHFNNDKKLRDQFVANTANMFHLLAETSGRVSLSMFQVSKNLDRQVQSEHGRSDHSSHIEQNN